MSDISVTITGDTSLILQLISIRDFIEEDDLALFDSARNLPYIIRQLSYRASELKQSGVLDAISLDSETPELNLKTFDRLIHLAD